MAVIGQERPFNFAVTWTFERPLGSINGPSPGDRSITAIPQYLALSAAAMRFRFTAILESTTFTSPPHY
jgi:hypothetical protein